MTNVSLKELRSHTRRSGWLKLAYSNIQHHLSQKFDSTHFLASSIAKGDHLELQGAIHSAGNTNSDECFSLSLWADMNMGSVITPHVQEEGFTLTKFQRWSRKPSMTVGSILPETSIKYHKKNRIRSHNSVQDLACSRNDSWEYS
jgi:hypothetical protein